VQFTYRDGRFPKIPERPRRCEFWGRCARAGNGGGVITPRSDINGSDSIRLRCSLLLTGAHRSRADLTPAVFRHLKRGLGGTAASKRRTPFNFYRDCYPSDFCVLKAATPLALNMVPVERIELPTFGLQNRCSTAELNRQLIDAQNPTLSLLPAATGGRCGSARRQISDLCGKGYWRETPP
jgi:hypothetical protein